MKSVRIEDLREMSYLSDLQLSNDGQFAAFIAHKCNENMTGYDSALWQYDFNNDEAKFVCKFDGKAQFSWSMDNEIIIIKKDMHLHSAVLLNPVTGKRKLLFETDIVIGCICQISGTRYVIEAEILMDGRNNKNISMIVIDELPFLANGKGFISGKRKALFLYDSLNGSFSQITPENFDVSLYCYCEKKDNLFVYGQDHNGVKDIYGEILEFSLSGREPEKLLDKGIMRVSYMTVFDGDIFLSATKGIRYNVSENDIFYLMDMEQGLLSEYYDADLYVNSLGMVSDCRYGSGKVFKMMDKNIFFTAIKAEHSYLFHLDVNKALHILTPKDIAVDFFDTSQDKIVFIGISDKSLQELYIVENGICRRLTGFNEGFFNDRPVIKPIPCNFINTASMEIGGFVMLPPGFKNDKKYPAILNIHGGPKLAFGGIYNHEMQVWAQNGYIVFYCNPRGSDGRGNEHAFLLGRYGTVDYDDFMEFTDHVIRQYPEIDTESIGVTGGSYGGYMTNWIVGHTSRFAAAISQRSIGDMITHEGASDSGYWVIPCMFPGTAVENHSNAWNQSPAKYAADITTPILFIHADEDYRCIFSEMAQVYEKALRGNIRAEICLFHGENHELSRTGKPSNRIKRIEKMLNWFDKYLKGIEEV